MVRIAPFLALCFLAAISPLFGQTPKVVWGYNLAHMEFGPGESSGEVMGSDAQGNVFLAGNFSGTLDFDPGPGVDTLSADTVDAFYLQKLDQHGDLQWVRTIKGKLYTYLENLHVDAQGNSYLVGEFRGSIDFDPGPGVAFRTAHPTKYMGSYSWDSFILKLDSAGQFEWVATIYGADRDNAFEVAVDASGAVYVAGNFKDSADFDPGPGMELRTTPFGPFISNYLLKLDVNGQFVWVKDSPYFGKAETTSMAIASDGSLYYTTEFGGSIDFDLGPGTTILTSAGSLDIAILKMTPEGNLIWAKALSGTDILEVKGLVVDSAHVYLGGAFKDTADFDPGSGQFLLGSQGVYDGFMVKLDSSGQLQWARNVGGIKDDIVNDIALDKQGNLLAGGRFSATADFDPGPGYFPLWANPLVWSMELFVVSLDQAGNFNWAIESGSPKHSWTTALVKGSDDAFHVMGTYIGSPDFDPSLDTLTFQAQTGTFHIKLEPSPTSFITIKDTACATYTFPSGTQTVNSSGIFIDSLTSSTGHDSILTVELVIHLEDLAVYQDSNQLIALGSASAYQWLACGQALQPIPGATDQSFMPTTSGAYAVELTANGCVDTSACYSIMVLSTSDHSPEKTLRIFPNPTAGPLHIALENGSISGTVSILNAQGQILHRQEVQDETSIQLTLPGAAGIYFLQVEAANRPTSYQMVLKQ